MATETTSPEASTTTQIATEVDHAHQDIFQGVSLKNVFTIGGLIGLTIAGAFMVRAYLDVLRIKKLREEEKSAK